MDKQQNTEQNSLADTYTVLFIKVNNSSSFPSLTEPLPPSSSQSKLCHQKPRVPSVQLLLPRYHSFVTDLIREIGDLTGFVPY
jgi:hypothetical protein